MMGCVWVVSVLLVVLLVQGVIVSGETGLHSSLLDKRDCYLGVIVSCVVDFPRHDELIITHRLKQNSHGEARKGRRPVHRSTRRANRGTPSAA